MGKKSKVTIGYRYYMGLLMGLCRGPVDAIKQIRVGDKTAWTGHASGNATISINKPDLFGGEEQEGGIDGNLVIMMGAKNQPRHAGLATMLGGLVSAFRGVCTTYFDGLVCAMSPYPKEWSYLVQKTKAGWHNDQVWYPETAEIQLVDGSEEMLISYDSAWRYREVGAGVSADYSGIDVDDSSWSSGRGGFGNLAQGYLTPPANTLIFGGISPTTPHNVVWLRCKIARLENGQTLRIKVWADDYAKLWVNGNLIPLQATSTPFMLVAEIDNALQLAENVIALRVEDGGDSPTTNPTYIYAAMELVGVRTDLIAMNPAHILYRLYTDPRIGRGLPPAMLDDAAWRAAADTFFAEGFGLCLKWSRSSPLADFTQSVIDHAGAVVYTSRRTGLIVLKPIRDDYDADVLPLFTPDTGMLGLDDDSASAQSNGINEVVVNYFDPLAKADKAVREKNLGAILAMNSVTVSETVDYPGLSTESLARRVARRDLLAKSGLIKRFAVRLDRRGKDLMPGAVFRISDPARGIENMVLRAGRVDYGTVTAGTVTVTALQDVFGLPATVYREPEDNGYIPPDATPRAPSLQRIVETTHRDLVQHLGQSEAQAVQPTSGYLMAMAVAPTPLSESFTLYSRVSPAAFEAAPDAGAFCPGGRLTGALDRLSTSVTLSNAVGLDLLEVGTAALIDDEIVRIDAIHAASATLTIARGCVDTVPALHAAGVPVLCFDTWGTADRTEHTSGVAVEAKLRTRTSAGIMSMDAAETLRLTFSSRAYRPYPPGNVRINGRPYPAEVTEPAVTLSWTHRDRLQQADQVIDTAQASIGPEAGVTYNIKNYDGATNELLYESLGYIGSSLAISRLARSNRLELWSQRGAQQSWQKHILSFDYAYAFNILGAAGHGTNLESYRTELSTDVAGAVVWSISAGSLPLGLHLSSAGVIAGVPNDAEGYYSVTIRAEINGAVATKDILIGVGKMGLLMHFDGVDGATTFRDETGKAVTRAGATAEIDTAFSKFGGASGLFGGEGGYATVANSQDFALGQGPFTISCWLRPADVPTGYFYSPWGNWSSDAAGTICLFLRPGRLLAVNTKDSDGSARNLVIDAPVWNAASNLFHVEVSRGRDNVGRVHINGTLVHSAPGWTVNLSSLLGYRVGHNRVSTDQYPGHIDELQVRKGVALHEMSSFTPPVAPSDYPRPAPDLAIYGSLPTALANAAYSSSAIKVHCINAPFSLAVEGALPGDWVASTNGAGITVSGAGVPAGDYTFTLVVSDTAGHTARLPLTVIVSTNGGTGPDPELPASPSSLDLYMHDGVQFIAARMTKGGLRFYGSPDGATFTYLGSMVDANVFSRIEECIVRGAAGYASFPKYFASSGGNQSWFSAVIPDFARSHPPRAWTSSAIGSPRPLCITWDAQGSRYLRVMDDQTITSSVDGLSWVTVGAMTLPALPGGWTWFTGMRMSLFRQGSFWYAMHSAGGYRYQADSTMLMRSTDLATWSLCPGTGFYSPPPGVSSWHFFMVYAVANRGSTFVITARGRRVSADAPMKELVLRSTDGLNFSIVYEAAAFNTTGDQDFKAIKAVGTAGFVSAGPGGLLVSADNGLTWERHAMTPEATELRSDGLHVIATRATAAAGETECWYTANGVDWTQCGVRHYRPGAFRHWRVRAVRAIADVTFAELALFTAAGRLSAYTLSQGAGTGIEYVDDGSSSTFWTATAADLADGAAWIAFDAASAEEVTAIELRAPSNDIDGMPSGLEIEASADGLSWTPIWFEDGLSWTPGEAKRMERAA